MSPKEIEQLRVDSEQKTAIVPGKRDLPRYPNPVTPPKEDPLVLSALAKQSPSTTPTEKEPKLPHPSEAVFTLTPGTELGGYTVEALIAQGAMGEIWRAKNSKIGKLAAIKVPSPALVARKDAAERFLQEARAVNEIRHRNIVDIFAFGDLPDGRPYFVMEYLDGMPLSTHLQKNGPVPTPEILDIFVPVCQALQAAHDAGIIHRDLKSENIFLTFDKKGRPFVKVLDFGIAKLKGAFANDNKNLTMDGAIYGTPSYMSPEQCQGAKSVDHRADVYSLAVVLYEMLTGRLPFREPDGNTGMLLVKHIAMNPFAPSRVVEGRSFPKEIDDLLLRALSKKLEVRPQSCEAFAEEFTRAAKELREETREAVAGAKPLLSLEPNEMGGSTQEPNPTSAPAKTAESLKIAEAPLPEPPKKEETLDRDASTQVISLPEELQVEALVLQDTPTAEVNVLPLASTSGDSKNDMATPDVAIVLHESPKPKPTPWLVYAGAVVGVAMMGWLFWPAPSAPKATMPASQPLVEAPQSASVPASEPASEPTPALNVPVEATTQLLQVKTSPPSAQVFLNGELLGVTPLAKETAPIKAGDVLRVVKAGYDTIELKLNPEKAIPVPLFLVKKKTKNALPPNPFKTKTP